MELMAGQSHHAVTSTGTWSCMRDWHRPTRNSCIMAYAFHINCRIWSLEWYYGTSVLFTIYI